MAQDTKVYLLICALTLAFVLVLVESAETEKNVTQGSSANATASGGALPEIAGIDGPAKTLWFLLTMGLTSVWFLL